MCGRKAVRKPRKMTRSVKEMTVCAVLCAALCVVCPFMVPVGAVPVTLATFAVCCIGAVAGLKRGLIAVALYLLIGAVGVPVFAGFRGGVSVFASPTGGFLVGYLLLVAAVGFTSDRTDSRAALCGAFCGGTVLLYLLGGVWYALSAHVSFFAALAVCALPFLPFDAVKIAAATMLSPRMKKSLQQLN